MKRNALAIIIIVALLALAGCVSGIQVPPTMSNQKNKLPPLGPPACFNGIPLGDMFRKESVGIKITLSPDWMVNYGFSKIKGRAVLRTTFPAGIEKISWAWVERKKYTSFLKAILYVPGHNVKIGFPKRADIYILTEFKNGHLRLKQEKINWTDLVDFSGKSEEGRSNLRNLLTRFSVVHGLFVPDGTLTDLSPELFKEQQKKGNFFRRFFGSAPPASPVLVLPATWIPYGIGWIGNATATEIRYREDNIASVQEIKAFLKSQNQRNPKVELLWKALKKRERKEEQIHSALQRVQED